MKTDLGMMAEADEAPAAVARFLQSERRIVQEIGRIFRARSPRVITTAARGSSDHAATFFKYLAEMTLGIPVASLGPSLASIYDRPLRLDGAIHVTVSQSGESPDLQALQAAAARGGALTIAVVNAPESPVAATADIVVDIHAGPERSVAATKSFIASAAALAAIIAAASEDAALAGGLASLPHLLSGKTEEPSTAAIEDLARIDNLYCVGRGPAYAMACETALKFKEVANIHAEAFSLAEIMHGPLSLVRQGFPVLGIVPEDEALGANRASLARLEKAGAALWCHTHAELPGRHLPMPRTGHAATDALAAMLPVYRLVHAIALARGLDPESPPLIAKVTRTN